MNGNQTTNESTTKSSNYITFGDYQIYYSVHGRGKHKLLMLPGSLYTSEVDFEHQIASLDLNYFTLVLVDTPGFGRSWPPNKNLTRDDFHRIDAEAAAQVMTSLGFDKFSVFGFSDGGRASLYLAADQQKRVDRLIFASCNAFLTDEGQRKCLAIRDIGVWTDDRRKLFEPIYGDRLQEVWGKYVDKMLNVKVPKELLLKIKCPTMLVKGEKDWSMDKEQVNYFRNSVRNLVVKTISGAGHYVHQESPDELNSCVSKFLKLEDYES